MGKRRDNIWGQEARQVTTSPLRFRPTSTFRMSGIYERIPEISDSFPQPLFLRSSIVSLMVPDEEIISPSYFWDFTLFMSCVCTFSVGHGTLHFTLLLICKTTLVSLDIVNLCVSIKELIIVFFCTDVIPHFEIQRLSSTMPWTPISIFGLFLYL